MTVKVGKVSLHQSGELNSQGKSGAGRRSDNDMEIISRTHRGAQS